jgi:hypothetical protein
VIASEVVQYLRDAGGDEVARSDAVRQLCDAAERYAPDHQWFVDTMNQLFEVAGERLKGGGSGGDNCLVRRKGWGLMRERSIRCIAAYSMPRSHPRPQSCLVLRGMLGLSPCPRPAARRRGCAAQPG